MQLSELLQKVGSSPLSRPLNEAQIRYYQQATVRSLVADSRQCQPGDVFIGMPGSQVDGGQFARQALDQGAIAAVISDRLSPVVSEPDDPRLIRVEDVAIACANLAAAFYDYPAQTMKMVGVTGTNGKTTTTHLIDFLLQSNYSSALFGTLYARWQGHLHTANHTTPFAIDLQALLRQAVDSGSQVGVMEVSSHALDQKRVWSCPFEVAVFTNLTQDHLDYHRDMEDYFQTKALLFGSDYLKGKAIINLDDPYGRRLADLVHHTGRSVWTYSLSDSTADFYAEHLTYDLNGVQGLLHSPAGKVNLRSPLVGSFNVANVLAAIATALHLGIALEEIVAKLPDFTNVPGRVERVQVRDEQDIIVVVDYAHTPDSLENLLNAMRPSTTRELICVFGCGGDRDRTKRPLMGGIAIKLADQVYITSDNPRTESPQVILADILAGIQPGVPGEVKPVVEVDRRRCIQLAIGSAQPGDTVLIAGKGHEDYQILGKEKIHFDDREEARICLKQKYGLKQ